jgi:hypothetical protein
MKLTESQRISQEWRALDCSLTNPPEIFDAEQEEVTRMIDYYKSHHKVENDFDVIVNSKSLNDHLGYKIPENKVPLTKTGKPKAPATVVPSRIQREALRIRKPPSQTPSVGGTPGNIPAKENPRPNIHTVPSNTSVSREKKKILGCSRTQGHDAVIDLRFIVESEVPLFQEIGGGGRDGHPGVSPSGCGQFGGWIECRLPGGSSGCRDSEGLYFAKGYRSTKYSRE